MRRALLVLLLAAAQVVTTPGTASAASADGQFIKRTITINGTYTPIVGAFDCDEGIGDGPFPESFEETGVLLYAPGSAPDFLWTDLSSTGGFSRTQTRLTIDGTYVPVRGDFDGDRCDDILWYSPNSNADPIWWGGPTGFTRGARMSVPSGYVPVPGMFGGADMGIFWYAPNGTERLWLGTGNRGAPFRRVPAPQVSGTTYRPAAFANGASGAGELLWHAPGRAPDSVWRYHVEAGAMVVEERTPVTLNGSYQNAGCRTSAELHDRSTGIDRHFTATGPSYVVHELSISGSYTLAASGLRAERCTILWHRPGAASDQIWFPRF